MIFSSRQFLELLAAFLIVTLRLPTNAENASNYQGSVTQPSLLPEPTEGMFDHQFQELPTVVHISVLSSRSQVSITINDHEIVNVTSPKTGDEGKTSGLYFVLLNQHDGHVIMSRVFDLHHYGKNLQVPPVFTALAAGRIMILAVKTDASLNMGNIIRNLLYSLGSAKVHKLPFRDYMVWVASVHGRTWAEAIIDDMPGDEGYYGAPVMVDVVVPLNPLGPCWEVSEEREAQRWRFCRRFGGYGALCECDRPAPLHYPPRPLDNSAIDDVPLGIIASARPQALYRCLLTVLRQAGGSLDRILVLVDGHNEETMALLDLLRVRYTVHDMSGRSFPGAGARISAHFRFALHTLFTTFPRASKAIILEEDLLVAPDFFSYFNQTAWLLDADPSLFCVSAWNDLGALHIARYPDRLYRVETHAGYGWMLTRSLLEEIYPQWKSPDKEHDWDVWLRSAEIRAGRECVVPDVSRTFHNGVVGAHINGVLTQSQFAGHAVTAEADVRLNDVDKMTMLEYEKYLYGILESDNIYYLNTTRHPCSKAYVPRNFTDGPVVIFITMESNEQHGTWRKIASCLGVWHLDTRSHHRGLFRLSYYETELFIIGYPFSDYSYLKPWWVHVMVESDEQDEILINRMTLDNRLRFRRPELESLSPFLLLQRSTPEPAVG
ncbi:protein O-linked-mannose beta-1,2-N-acetylglucosaminyltransferase 1-like [Penaeus japonicus]|uniref:protein O-linked-mannose beta-1,2-N-acetylglucosaminyltransferase 1-like n=1 Tax=Penaeus japonicus TaxID=27405 RepID=UPI001C70D3B9|nr:protein O-linked-mannose beta-1,2-N-acetylglucosaminyltransferase 1-like [Penaeus japonicus]